MPYGDRTNARRTNEDCMDFHHCDAGAFNNKELCMSNTNTGGPAFPTGELRNLDTNEIVLSASQGITLRDYFAAKAMQGLVTHAHVLEWPEEAIADAAYRQADAMLKAREA